MSLYMNISIHLKKSKLYTLFTNSTLGVSNVHCITLFLLYNFVNQMVENHWNRRKKESP